MSTASLVIAGAVAWCAQNPAEFECQEIADPIAAELSIEQYQHLERIANRVRFRYEGTRSQGPERDSNSRDVWRVSRGGRDGDCEDRVLWAWRYFREHDMEIGNAALPVVLRGETGQAHIVLLISTTRGSIVIDCSRAGLQQPRDYPGMQVYFPEVGVGGRWVRVN